MQQGVAQCVQAAGGGKSDETGKGNLARLVAKTRRKQQTERPRKQGANGNQQCHFPPQATPLPGIMQGITAGEVEADKQKGVENRYGWSIDCDQQVGGDNSGQIERD